MPCQRRSGGGGRQSPRRRTESDERAGKIIDLVGRRGRAEYDVQRVDGGGRNARNVELFDWYELRKFRRGIVHHKLCPDLAGRGGQFTCSRDQRGDILHQRDVVGRGPYRRAACKASPVPTSARQDNTGCTHAHRHVHVVSRATARRDH
jgi:hypothetical protein